MKMAIDISIGLILIALTIMDLKGHRVDNKYTYALIGMGAIIGVLTNGMSRTLITFLFFAIAAFIVLEIGIFGGADIKIFAALALVYKADIFFMILINSIVIGGIFGILLIGYKLITKQIGIREVSKVTSAFIPCILFGFVNVIII